MLESDENRYDDMTKIDILRVGRRTLDVKYLSILRIIKVIKNEDDGNIR